jgi:hypothetical protein
MLSTRLLLCLPSGHFPSDFSTNNVYVIHFNLILDTYIDHFILLDLIILFIIEEDFLKFRDKFPSRYPLKKPVLKNHYKFFPP